MLFPMQKMNANKVIKWGGLLIIVVTVLVSGLLLWARHLLSESQNDYIHKIGAAEKDYLETMKNWLSREDDPRDTYDVQFFMSSGVLEKIVQTLQGRVVQFNDSTTLSIDSLSLDMRTGFPLVTIGGEYKDTKTGLSFGGRAAAYLSLEKQEEGFFFRIRPVSIQPSLGFAGVRFVLSGMVGSVSEAVVRDYAGSWPGVKLPFERFLPVRVPSIAQPVVIKIGGKAGDPYIGTEFEFPALDTDLKIVYEGLLFTSEGVSLFANLEKAGKEKDHLPEPSAEWSKLSVPEKISALGFGGKDIGVRVSKRVFAFAVARVNEMPLANKLITFRGKDRYGDLFHGNAGPFYYQVWLENPPALHGTMQIDTMSAVVSTEENEIIRYHATGVVQVQGQLGLAVELGKPKDEGKARVDPNPVAVQFAPTQAVLNGAFVLNTDDPTLPIIAIMMDEQKDVALTARLRIPGFGHVTIHPKFTLPHSRMTRIKLPLEINNHGAVRLAKQEIPYHLEITAIQSGITRHYLSMTATAALSTDGDKSKK